jgi:hypothetical protein
MTLVLTDAKIDELLKELDEAAEGFNDVNLGLPIGNNKQMTIMREIVRKWAGVQPPEVEVRP